MKKTATVLSFILLAFLFSSCNIAVKASVDSPASSSAPSTPVQVAETSPAISAAAESTPPMTSVLSQLPTAAATETTEPSDTGVKVALSSKQLNKINALLTGALSMSVNYVSDDNDDSDNSVNIDDNDVTNDFVFFDNAASLSVDELLGFAYIILGDSGDTIVKNMDNNGPISSKTVENIISSAFGVKYTPKNGDGKGSSLEYQKGRFEFTAGDDQDTDAYIYSVTRQSSGRLLLKFNIVYNSVPENDYMGKGEAVLQEDAKSLFGYRLISLTQYKDVDISFTGAEASSCLTANGSKTFAPVNAIDGDDKTAWATSGGKGEWIKLTFDKPQNITGLILHFGDWSSYDALENSVIPVPCSLEFSDGTVIQDVEDGYTIDTDVDPCVAFSRVITTTYVKIKITGLETREGYAPAGTVAYISEVKPF